jgi:hypothetical protein
VIRNALDIKPWAHAFVGQEDRYLALACDDPWARRRSIRLADVATRTIALDRRTGTTTLNLWPENERPAASRPLERHARFTACTVVSGGRGTPVTCRLDP